MANHSSKHSKQTTEGLICQPQPNHLNLPDDFDKEYRSSVHQRKNQAATRFRDSHILTRGSCRTAIRKLYQKARTVRQE